MKPPKKIHFMGVGGSGISGVAMLAHAQGYIISGCDVSETTAYIDPVKKITKDTFLGHGPKHLIGVDLVITSPAVLYLNKDNPELLEAQKKKIPVITWEKFLGQYLLRGKKVICIAGTHGKSTTTAMLALLFEKAGLDPSVMVGANVKEWGVNYRVGKGEYFIVEADEFNNNFLNYHPETIILNNIEFDHPDFFKNEDEVFTSFKQFLSQLTGPKNLVVNADSVGIKKLLGELVPGYSTKDIDIKLTSAGSEFKVDGQTYHLKVSGVYNVSNALGVIAVAKLYGIKPQAVAKVLADFGGIGRRMDLLGEVDGISVYDDYAHHPTAIKATLEGLRQKYPKNKIWVVYEPHSYSRTKALLADYKGVFDAADKIIITQIYKARDTSEFGVNEASVVKASKHKNAQVISDFSEVVKEVVFNSKQGDVVIVMGAGKSYLLARDILNNARFKKEKIVINKPLANLTTTKTGGVTRYFTSVKTEKELINLVKKTQDCKIDYLILAGGSNLLFNDTGFNGLVIKNELVGIKKTGKKVIVKSGTSLQTLINFTIDHNLGGLEAMSWIPGTVGGAVYGNAGAYGQTISDFLTRVKIFDGLKTFWLSKKDCLFTYRSSTFKSKGWVILEVEFSFLSGDKKELRKKADEIIAIRKVKFPLTMKCPGSFFKNIEAATLTNEMIKKIPTDKITGGKIPAGYLMEQVGAKGATLGGAKILDYHGNLIVNDKHASSSDMVNLAYQYAKKVEEKFGIKLEPEVQIL